MCRTIPVFVLLLAGWVARAHAGDVVPYARHPGSLIAEIAKRGAAPVVADLNERASWVRVTDTIAEGNRDWLMVGLALLQGADGGSSDDLHLAVNRALIPNPAAVFDLFAGQVDPSRICWAVAEFGGHRTVESALRELQSKIASIESCHTPGEPRVADFKAECLAKLREGEPQLYQIYGETPP
jgi:hypothetical protein